MIREREGAIMDALFAHVGQSGAHAQDLGQNHRR